MANPFFNAIGNGGPQPPMQGGNFMQMLQQLRQNPAQFIMQRRFNIPQNLMQNPEAMVQHLVQSGQISQQQLAEAQRKLAEWQGRVQGQGQNTNSAPK